MLKQLLSIFLESRCAFCDRVAYPEGNRAAYPQGDRYSNNVLCSYCQAKLNNDGFASGDRLLTSSKIPVFAWGKYDRELKRAIALMKYNDRPEIGNVLGTLLGQAWLDSEFSRQKVTVVPIPLHHKKFKARGFNQAQIIAQSFCRLTGYELNNRALIRIRETEAMFNLATSAQRLKNLQGAMKVGGKLPQHPVLLIDDIHTTGITVKESIKVLQYKKIKVMGVAVVAKAGLLN